MPGANGRPRLNDRSMVLFFGGNKKKRILIVDDDSAFRALIREILEGDGFEVSEAADGRMGQGRALEQMPDMIIMDVTMPDMSGFEATQNLRSHSKTKGIPILMYTNRDRVVDIERSLGMGADEFLPKEPFQVERLREKVRKLLKIPMPEPPPASS